MNADCVGTKNGTQGKDDAGGDDNFLSPVNIGKHAVQSSADNGTDNGGTYDPALFKRCHTPGFVNENQGAGNDSGVKTGKQTA